MSEGIVIALIGFVGAVLGAAIAGFATVTAAGIKGKGEGSISCGLVGLLASLGAAGGLVLGAVFGASLIQNQAISTPQSSYPTSPPLALQTAPTQSVQSGGVIPTSSSFQSEGPFREHKQTPIVGTGVLAQGTYSDGMAPFDETEILKHLNIQRIRLEENPDGCAIAVFNADKIWFGSSVKTSLSINGVTVGAINGPTGKHGYIFDVHINTGDKICVTYFEPSGFHIFLGPDLYYHYDSYCYRGHCR